MIPLCLYRLCIHDVHLSLCLDDPFKAVPSAEKATTAHQVASRKGVLRGRRGALSLPDLPSLASSLQGIAFRFEGQDIVHLAIFHVCVIFSTGGLLLGRPQSFL